MGKTRKLTYNNIRRTWKVDNNTAGEKGKPQRSEGQIDNSPWIKVNARRYNKKPLPLTIVPSNIFVLLAFIKVLSCPVKVTDWANIEGIVTTVFAVVIGNPVISQTFPILPLDNLNKIKRHEPGSPGWEKDYNDRIEKLLKEITGFEKEIYHINRFLERYFGDISKFKGNKW